MSQNTSDVAATIVGQSKAKKGLTTEDYNELLGRLMTRKGVKGVAVTSGDGNMIYHNDSIPTEILSTYIEVVSSIEYLCTVAARENDPNCQWQYVRFETDDYEMMVTVASTHWVYLLAEPQENYNGEKEEENISKLGAAV